MGTDSDREKNTQLLGLINILGDDYTNIYLVNRKTQQIEIYRYRNQDVDVEKELYKERPYESAMTSYIENKVVPEDRRKMSMETNLAAVCEHLTRVSQFTVHYRVRRNGEIQFYYMKCARIGEADDFESIVFAFANEDIDVRRNGLSELLKPGGTASKRKVLIVEDNELNREILSSVLSENFEVLMAEDGEEGLKLLAGHYRDLSVILLDICMPVCDGFEFLKRSQSDPLLASVPVIVTTGSNQPDVEIQCLDLGASDFIAKPYNSRVVIGRINSSYGEKVGDQMLCYLGRAFNKNPKLGLIARYGSDQFVCMTYGNIDLSPANVKESLAKIAADAPVPNVRVKCGIYENIDKSQPISVLCDRGFLALKSIRDNYECNVAYYTREMNEKQNQNRVLENRFEEAIRDREFVVYFQAKYDVKTDKIVGAESLVRWINKDGSMVMPGDFIPLYERDGLIVRLDEYVFREVCRFQRDTMERGEELLPVSVNLSRASIHHSGVVERYVEIVKEYGIPPSCVPIELTETATLYNEQIRKFTDMLVNEGFRLHMDDFGSGYSSLITLNELPFTTLKIDKSLIDYIEKDKGKKVVRQVINLAHGLDMDVIAEGVETLGQVKLLRKMECDNIQGFYYARPQPKDVYIEMLRKKQ